MYAAEVTKWGDAPVCREVEQPPVPAADSDEMQVKVAAVGVHSLVRVRALGKHYSTKTLPHVPGTDGVGTLADGTPVYFANMGPAGTFAQFVNVKKAQVFALPPRADPAQIAALVNPGFSSWMALRHRVKDLPRDFSVLIMGATSASGKIAVHFARKLGAARVVGCARNAETLDKLGLDDAIVLKDPVEETDFSKANDVDVILDYLWGPPTTQLLTVLKPSKPLQFAQIGSLAGPETTFRSDILRSKDLTMRGSGFGSWTPEELSGEIEHIVEALMSLEPQEVTTAPLKDIAEVWGQKIAGRLVFLP